MGRVAASRVMAHRISRDGNWIGPIKQKRTVYKVPVLPTHLIGQRWLLLVLLLLVPAITVRVLQAYLDARVGTLCTLWYQYYHPEVAADMPRSACSGRDLLGSDGQQHHVGPVVGASS